MTKNNTKISNQLYVHLIKRGNCNVPTAHMIPYGTDKAAQNRINTLNRNVRGWNTVGGNSGPCIIDNAPLSGFKLAGKLYTGGTGQDSWTVLDPRGFYTEISSDVLMNLLMNSATENGEILSPCVWGQNRSGNILISVHSNEYKIAVSNTNAANSKGSWRDVKIGDTILLRNNIKGVWLGKLYPVFHSYYGVYKESSVLSQNEIQISDKPYHVVYVKDVDNKSYPHGLHIISSPQLSRVIDTSNRIDAAQAEILVNELISDSSCREYSNLYRKIVAMSMKPDLNFKIESTPVSINNDQELISLLEQGTVNPLVFCNTSSGDFGKLKLNAPNRYTKNTTSQLYIIKYDQPSFNSNQLRRTLEKSNTNKSYTRTNYWQEIHSAYNFDSSDQFYILSFNMTTPIGNIINLTLT